MKIPYISSVAATLVHAKRACRTAERDKVLQLYNLLLSEETDYTEHEVQRNRVALRAADSCSRVGDCSCKECRSVRQSVC